MPSRKNAAKRRRTSAKRRAGARTQRAVIPRAVRKNKIINLDEVNLNSIAPGAHWFDPLIIPHGTDHDKRIGHTIFVTGMWLRGVLHNNTTKNQVARIVVLKTDIDANFGTTTDFLESPNDDAGASTTDLAGLKSIYMPIDGQVCETLMDKVFMLGPLQTYEGVRTWSHFIRFSQPMEVKYRGGNFGADNVFPRVHIGAWTAESDEDPGLGEVVELSAMCKTYFFDG